MRSHPFWTSSGGRNGSEIVLSSMQWQDLYQNENSLSYIATTMLNFRTDTVYFESLKWLFGKFYNNQAHSICLKGWIGLPLSPG